MTDRSVTTDVTTTGATPADARGFLAEDRSRETLDAARALYEEGLVSWDEMMQILQASDEHATRQEVFGLAAGEFDVTRDDFAEAFGEDQAKKVEAKMRGYGEWWKRATTRALRPFAAITGWAWEGIVEGREEEQTLDVQRDRLEDIVRQLEDDGVIFGGRGGEASDLITMAQTGNADSLRELSDRISQFSDVLTEDQVATINVHASAPVAPAAEQRFLPEEERAALEAERGDWISPGAPIPPAGSFAAFLREDLIQPGEPDYLPVDIAPPPIGISPPEAFGFSAGGVPGDSWYDKSTNTQYTAEEYQRILEGRQMVASRYGPDAAYSFGPSGQVVGGGRIGEAFAEAELGPNLNDPRVRGAYQTAVGGTGQLGYGGQSLSTMPGYLQETIKQPSLFPDQPWEKEAYKWSPGSSTVWLNGLSSAERRRWERSLQDRGLFNVSDEQGRTYFNSANQNFMVRAITEQVLGISRGQQINPWSAVPVLGAFKSGIEAQQRAFLAHSQALQAALAPKKDPFTVPRSLRSIPDAREIAQDSKATFRRLVGRAPTENDLDNIANQLTGFHRTSQQQQIDLAYAEWEEQDNIMDGFDLEETILNPAKVLAEEVEQKWANEINLNERQEISADSFNRVRLATGGNIGSMAATPTLGENVVRV